MRSLYEQLVAYNRSDYYGFHMPGHKRNAAFLPADLPFGIDITEIEGFDDLHCPEGILLDLQKQASAVFGAEESLCLVNGSTAGNLGAILGVTKYGDRILVARNCHRSVYHGVELNGLVPVYVYPSVSEGEAFPGAIKSAEVERILREEEQKADGKIRAVVITSPTYEGVVSDVASIAEVAHKFEIPLIVDEAHGGHFGFSDRFPENANRLGADIVIHSLHKTLPALTQTALLHMNGTRVDRKRVRRYVSMMQSSSPSYVLMASMDVCIRFLEKEASGTFQKYVADIEKLQKELKKLKNLQYIKMDDIGKIIISTKGAGKSGKWLYDRLLTSAHLQMEMAADTYVLAMTSVADRPESLRKLGEALAEIDRTLPPEKEVSGREISGSKASETEVVCGESVYTPGQAMQLASNTTAQLLEDCVGAVAMEYVYPYPPGVPVLVPGERITREAVDFLQGCKELGVAVRGMASDGKIEVLTDE